MRSILALSVFLFACGQQKPAEAPETKPAAAAEAPAEAAAPAKAEPAAAEAAATEGEASEWASYGAEFTVTDILPAATVMASPAEYADKEIAIEGEIVDVCQKMGCWLVVTDGKSNLRVTIKDHAFGVDKQSFGATARLQGIMVSKEIDPDMVEHIKGEASKPEEMPEAKLAEGQTTQYEFVASSITMKKKEG